MPSPPFATLDAAAIARCLARLADQDGDRAEAYFERREEVELATGGEAPWVRRRHEEGFALRLVRAGRSWLVSRDGLSAAALEEALRRLARSPVRLGPTVPPLPPQPAPEPDEAPELRQFPGAVARRVRARHVAFPLRFLVRRHRRWRRVIGVRLAAEPEVETFYSVAVELPWGRYAGLFPRLDEEAAGEVARGLLARFHSRGAPPPPAAARGVAVLGPGAAAVLLHEAVAHALEADTLALTGNPEAAVGLRLAGAGLHVLDDPGAAPAPVRRATDDEGVPVVRRWLLRAGVVEQPLADSTAAAASAVLAPGAARRGDRHAAPAPRSFHLEVLPGEATDEDLLAGAAGGLFLPEAVRGSLDPLSGRFSLSVPYARRIEGAAPGERLGPCELTGQVGELMAAVAAVGRTPAGAGAGWCAKGGQRLAVWATTPALRLEGVEVRS